MSSKEKVSVVSCETALTFLLMFKFLSIVPVIICLKRITEGVVKIVKFKIS